jgi:hypothetical protein
MLVREEKDLHNSLLQPALIRQCALREHIGSFIHPHRGRVATWSPLIARLAVLPRGACMTDLTFSEVERVSLNVSNWPKAE